MIDSLNNLNTLSRVSIIVTVYNRVAFLKAALTSACAQVLAPYEILVIDDGSDKAKAAEIAAIVAGFDYTKLIRLDKNGGVSAARNRGVEVATGDYLLFLDDDDWLDEHLLSTAVLYLEQQTTVDVFITKTSLFSEHVSDRFARLHRYYVHLQERYHLQSANLPAYFLIYCPAIHSMVFRKGLFQQHRFPEDLSYGEDRYLLMNMRKNGVIFHSADVVGGSYRIHQQESVPVVRQLDFIEKLNRSGWLRSPYEKAYLHLLKGYFLIRADHWLKALGSIFFTLQSPRVIGEALIAFVRSRF
ncbi:MAG: glycosyltransferase family A protein [Marinoscillum sp.]|uniref:glycosyltransferase family 2 protein n=1 Tax=Marinoscillum sp. TaxID=2024838 RepID=UPI0033006166